MSEPQDVYWLVTPLAIFGGDKEAFTKKSKEASKENPDAYRTLRWSMHWAIQVGNSIYETLATEGKVLDMKNFEKKGGPSKIFSKITGRIVPFETCSALRQKLHLDVRKRTVGQTIKSARIYEAYSATRIWSGFGQADYHPLVRNCQNFARLLYQTITLQPGEYEVPEREGVTWESMDGFVSYGLSDVSKAALHTGGGVGSAVLYAMTFAEIADDNKFDTRLLLDAASDATKLGKGTPGAADGAIESEVAEEAGDEIAEEATEEAAEGAPDTTRNASTAATTEAGTVEANSSSIAATGGDAVEIVGDPDSITEVARQTSDAFETVQDATDATQNASVVVQGAQNASDVADLVQDAFDFVVTAQSASTAVDAAQNASTMADAAQSASTMADVGQNTSIVVNTAQNASAVEEVTQNASTVVEATSGATDIASNAITASDALSTATDVGGQGAAALGGAQVTHVAAVGGAGGSATVGGTATAGTAAEGGGVANAAGTAGTGTQTAAGATKGAAATGKGAAGAGKFKGMLAAGKGAMASKGAAGTGAASGKMGLGAKALAAGHSATHGAAAAKVGYIGASMAKAGPKLALVHPIASVIVIATGAGLVYVTRKGRKDVIFNEKEAEKRRKERLRQFQELESRDKERGGKDAEWLKSVQGLVQKSSAGSVLRFDFKDALYGIPKEPTVELEKSEMDALTKSLEVTQIEGDGKA